MRRFILLTFGFLGWAFYEMSGGADFEPASVRMAATAPIEENVVSKDIVPDAITPKPKAVEERVAKIVTVDTTPPGFDVDVKEDTAKAVNVIRASLSLSSVEQAVSAAEAPLANEVMLVPVNAGSLTSSQDTPAIIPSLITPNDTGTVDVNSSSSGDIRSVAGNRVNVRGGPGTDFGIVSRLGRGDAVEIITDNGNGWVQMRPIDGGPVGWMADFLLTNS
jgi:hypothetical protein